MYILFIPEEGWFGQPKYSTRCIGLCFNYHHLYLLSLLDQPLIQRIYLQDYRPRLLAWTLSKF